MHLNFQKVCNFLLQFRTSVNSPRRSREGAWIEIGYHQQGIRTLTGRSREGAWIEISARRSLLMLTRRRSREGAWIEIGNGHESKQQLWSLP